MKDPVIGYFNHGRSHSFAWYAFNAVNLLLILSYVPCAIIIGYACGKHLDWGGGMTDFKSWPRMLSLGTKVHNRILPWHIMAVLLGICWLLVPELASIVSKWAAIVGGSLLVVGWFLCLLNKTFDEAGDPLVNSVEYDG